MPASHDSTRARASRLLAGLFMASMLAACGYKGPLYLPPPPAPDESLTTPPASATIPETEAGGQTDTPATPATPSPVQTN
ncbi:MAG: lipoprotein [Pusillimonas sp.]